MHVDPALRRLAPLVLVSLIATMAGCPPVGPDAGDGDTGDGDGDGDIGDGDGDIGDGDGDIGDGDGDGDAPEPPGCVEGAFCAVPLTCDNCPLACGACVDADADGVHDLEDNCPDTANADQADADDDGRGDVCDDGPPWAPTGSWPLGRSQSRMQLSPVPLADAYRLVPTAIEDVTPSSSLPYITRWVGCGLADEMCLEGSGPACLVPLAIDPDVFPPPQPEREILAVGDAGDLHLATSLLGGAGFDGSNIVLSFDTSPALELAGELVFDTDDLLAALGVTLAEQATLPRFFFEDVIAVGGALLAIGTLSDVGISFDGQLGYASYPLALGLTPGGDGFDWVQILTPVTQPALFGDPDSEQVARAEAKAIVSLGDGRFAALTTAGVSLVTVPTGVQAVPPKRSTYVHLASTSGLYFEPRQIASDDHGNLWVLGVDLDNPRPDACFVARETWVLRGYRPDLSLAYERTIHEDMASFPFLTVSHEVGEGGAAHIKVRVTGLLPNDDCVLWRRHYHKDPNTFVDSFDDPVACPSAFQERCANDFLDCPCSSCSNPAPYEGCSRYSIFGSVPVLDGTLVLSFLDVDDPFASGPVDTRVRPLPATGWPSSSSATPTDEATERFTFSRFGAFVSPRGISLPSNDTGVPDLARPVVAGLLDSEEPFHVYNDDGVIEVGDDYAQLTSWGPLHSLETNTTADVVRYLPLGEASGGRILVYVDLDYTLGYLLVMEPAPAAAALSTPPPSTKAPVIDACDDPRTCASIDLDLGTLSSTVTDVDPDPDDWATNVLTGGGWRDGHPLDLFWVHCVPEDTINSTCNVTNTNPCREADMIRQWEQARITQPLAEVTPQSGIVDDFVRVRKNVEVRCDRGSLVRQEATLQNVFGCTQRRVRLRCEEWTERYVPGPGRTGQPVVDVVSLASVLREDEALCTLGANEGRFVRVRGADYGVTVGDPVLTVDDSTTVKVTGDGATTRVEVVGGSASVMGGQGSTVPGQPPLGSFVNEQLTVTATGAGTIVLEITIVQSDGSETVVTVTIAVDDPQTACAFAAGNGTFSACSVKAPFDQEVTPALFENRVSPAMAGMGVLLHDRSLRLTTHDLTLQTAAGELGFARTYRSATPPTGGGLLGGWTFGFDERLVAQTPSGAQCSADVAPDAGGDVVFYDGTGRADRFVHPGTTTFVTLDGSEGPADAFYTVDHSDGTLEARAVEAEVVTYQAPAGRFETLKAYHLVVPDGMPASSVHPYYSSATSSVRPYEARFFVLEHEDGARRVFNCKGQLIRVLDAQYRETELLYDGPYSALTQAPLLSTIVDANGRRTELQWSRRGPAGNRAQRLTSITDPFGRVVRFGYDAVTSPGEEPADDADVRLTRVVVLMEGADPEVERGTRYAYDAAGRLTSVIGPDGEREMLVAYDAMGGVTRQELGRVPGADYAIDETATDTVITTFATSGDAVTVTSGRGEDAVYTLTTTPHGARAVASLESDAALFNEDTAAPEFTIQRLTTSYTYADSGAVATIAHPSGRVVAFTTNDAGQILTRVETPGSGTAGTTGGVTKTSTWSYDPLCHTVLTSTRPSGATTTRTLASWGAATPGNRCQVASVVRPDVLGPDGTTTVSYIDEFAYVEAGQNRGQVASQLTRRDGAEVRTITNQWELTVGSGAASPAGQTPTTRLGVLAERTISGPLPGVCGDSAASVREAYTSDERGNRLERRVERTAGALVTAWSYDMADRVIEERRGTGGLQTSTTREYDLRGLLVAERSQVNDMFSNPAVDAVASTTHVEQTAYDRLGRPLAIRIQEGDAAASSVRITLSDADGNTTDIFTPGPGATDEQVQALWEAVVPPSGSVSQTNDPRALVASLAPTAGMFDVNRGPVRVHDHRRFDARGLLFERRLSDGGPERTPGEAPDDDFVHQLTERFLRDAEGQVRLHDPGRTDRASTFTVSRYDGSGRLADVTVTDPSCPADGGGPGVLTRTEYANYDLDDVAHLRRRFGSRADTADPAMIPAVCEAPAELQVVDVVADAWGRVVSETTHVQAVATSLLDNHLNPDLTRTFAYDDRSRPVRTSFGQRATTVAFTPYDQQCASEERLGADRVRAVLETWDDGSLRTAMQERHEAPGSPTPVVVSMSYEHDTLGRVVTATDGVGMTRRRFYDSLDRLRAEREPRTADVYSPTSSYGVWSAFRYDALGRRTEERRYAYTIAGTSSDVRLKTNTWRGGFHLERGFGDAGGVRQREAWAYDITVQPVLRFPYGRADGRAATTVYNELGAPLIERTLDGVVRQHTVLASGQPITIDGTPPDPADIGHLEAAALTKTFRYNGLGHVTFAGIDEAGAAPAHNVVLRRDNQGRVLEEHTSSGARTRATYNSLGFRSALFYDGAPADDPDLSFTTDDRGLVTRIDQVGGRALFSGLLRIEYDHHGDKVTERRVVPLAGPDQLITRYRYDERGERTGVDHYRSGTALTDKFLTSRRLFYGLDLAASYTVPVLGGVEQGDVSGVLDALRPPDGMGGNRYGHLSSPPPFADQLGGNYDVYPGNPFSGVYTLYHRSPLGDEDRVDTVTYAPFTGRPAITFTANEREGNSYRTARVQTLTWLGDADGEPFANGRFTEWHHREVTFQSATGSLAPPDRVVGVAHRVLPDPPGASVPQLPRPSDYDGTTAIPSVRHYAYRHTQSNQDAGMGFGDDDPLTGQSAVDYDVFDRRARVVDGLTDVMATQVSGITPERALQQLSRWDALDRRYLQHYNYTPATGAGGSPLTTEKTRDFVYLDGAPLTEVNHPAVGANQIDHYVYGAAGDLPYAQLHFGGEVLLEDASGTFVATYDTGAQDLGGLSAATAAETAFKAQPYVKDQAALQADYDTGLFSFLTAAFMTPFPSLPDGQRYFRKTSAGSETNPFDGTSYTMALGHQRSFLAHPHHAHELLRLTTLAQTQALVTSLLFMPIVSIAGGLPYLWLRVIVFAAAVSLDAKQAYDLGREIDFNGFTANALLTTALMLVSFAGYPATLNRILPARPPQTTSLRLKNLRRRLWRNAFPDEARAMMPTRSQPPGRPLGQPLENVIRHARRIQHGESNFEAVFNRSASREIGEGMPIARARRVARAEMDEVLGRVMADGRKAEFAYIGRDSTLGAGGERVPSAAFFEPLERLRAQLNPHNLKVSAIDSFLGHVGPVGWSPHANLAWLEGVVRGRTPVILGNPVADFFQRRAHGMSFMEREYTYLTSRGYTLASTRVGGVGYGVLVPPP